MKLLNYIYDSLREYSKENLVLKYEREINKLHLPVLNGEVDSAHRLFKLLYLRDKIKAEQL